MAGVGALGPTGPKGADAQDSLIRLQRVPLPRLSLAALACFRKTGIGTLVNIASVIAFAPSAAGATYSGSKAFVLNFTRSLQLEYEKTDIRIQAVLPGPIRTEFFTAQGLDDSVFPASASIGPDELVEAELAGLASGEKLTVPPLVAAGIWDAIEKARARFLAAVVGGRVAERYTPVAFASARDRTGA